MRVSAPSNTVELDHLRLNLSIGGEGHDIDAFDFVLAAAEACNLPVPDDFVAVGDEDVVGGHADGWVLDAAFNDLLFA